MWLSTGKHCAHAYQMFFSFIYSLTELLYIAFKYAKVASM